MNILINITSTMLSVSLTNKKEKKDLNNTNIINTKELYFSYDYIKYNLELVTSFLNTIIIKNKVNKIRINNIELTTLCLDIINNIPSIKKLYISDNIEINYEIFLKLLDNKYLEYINCYDCPPYLLEKLDLNKLITIDIRSEILFLSNFMNDNKLYKYSDIYYKKSIIINNIFDKKEINDFKTFISINKYLKEININNYNNDLLCSILDIFKEYNINNKLIKIYENNNSNIILNSINYIKENNKSYLEENNIKFKIIYSKKYKKKNIFKQLNFVTFKYICLIVLIGALLFASLDYYTNYKDEHTVEDINENITDILDNYEYTEDTIENDIEYIDIDDEEENNTSSSTTPSSYYTNYNQVFDELSKINEETIGWIKINNTKINYPVVQHTDNDYYIKHDFNKKNNSYGWLFMDYRNNIYDLSDNTIIWGHNVKSGLMFGTLRYTTNESWYTNKDNQIIEFNTKVKNMQWQIFSIYKIPVTNDYLYANFGDRNEFQEFINKITSRSIYNFNINVTSNDHIITLTTCGSTSAQRLVVHAVLINE